MKLLNKILFHLQQVLFLLSVLCCFHFHSDITDKIDIIEITLDLFCMAISVYFFFFFLDESVKNTIDVIFMYTHIVTTLIYFFHILCVVLKGHSEYARELVLCTNIFYIVRNVLPLITLNYQLEVFKPNSKFVEALRKFTFVLFAVSTVMILFNIKFSFISRLDESTYTIVATKYYRLVEIFYLFDFSFAFFYVIVKKNHPKIKKTFLVMNTVPLIAAVFQKFVYNVTIVYAASALSSFLVYLNIHVEMRKKLDDVKTQLILNKVQPHFLFNSLSTVEALCDSNPELAAETTHHLADFLRSNIDTLSVNTLIPFETELKYINDYVKIQIVRFPNIKVEYKLDDVDFSVPPFTVQTLVENCMKHGVRNIENGLITIHSYFQNGFHIVEIHDNGNGFNVTKLNKELESGTGRYHFGIQSTKERLDSMCKGTLDILSEPGKGTSFVMKIKA